MTKPVDDIEMSGSDVALDPDTDKDTTPKPTNPREALLAAVAVLHRAARLKEARLLPARALHLAASIRRTVTVHDLIDLVHTQLPHSSPLHAPLTRALSPLTTTTTTTTEAATTVPPPEVELFIALRVGMYLCDLQKWDAAGTCLDAAMALLGTLNKRTCDLIGAQLVRYVALVFEKSGGDTDVVRREQFRAVLLGLHRTATLRHDQLGQETVMNLLLRSYIEAREYALAETFHAQAQRPDPSRSHTQHARYLHYLGRLRAVQLSYTEARDLLQQALRKAPGGPTATGFRLLTLKWLTQVRLLLGETPDRVELTQPQYRTALTPTLALTRAVRAGDLHKFSQVATAHQASFARDGTWRLVERLRNHVIRVGLHRLALAYSRLPLRDVAIRLGLDIEEADNNNTTNNNNGGGGGDRMTLRDVECIVAKAIRDGALHVTLDHQGQCLVSAETLDTYATYEPQRELHDRIVFCLDVHNEANKAMRFEPKDKAKGMAPGVGLMLSDEDLDMYDDDFY